MEREAERWRLVALRGGWWQVACVRIARSEGEGDEYKDVQMTLTDSTVTFKQQDGVSNLLQQEGTGGEGSNRENQGSASQWPASTADRDIAGIGAVFGGQEGQGVCSLRAH